MKPERWQQIVRILDEAWERAGAERSAYLDDACSGDSELRAKVEELLAADANPGEFLDAPPAGLTEIKRAALGEAIDGGPAGSDLAGTRVGRYTIQGLIGKGGMGAVYRAVREDDFRMQVAIKLLKRGTDTDTALERFRAERQILAGLQHPNIAHVIDGGATETGLPYLVMEYVDGMPLLEYAVSLPVRRRLELFRQVCAAVQHAHQNLIVHRDIKPANILVTAEGVPKLLDFGIAKLLDPSADGATAALTTTGVRLMTPDYASPEQVRGEPITTATDIYSLGTVLYELLTGKRAHRIQTYSMGEIEKEICLHEPKKPSALAKGLDADLDTIILMALRKEPERRYASVERFSEDIRLYLEGRPVKARKDTPRYRAGKFLRRNRVGVAVAALVLLGMASGVFAVQRQARRAERRFEQVRKLANTVLVDFDREIAPLAGATKARELLVKTSLEYLDSLAAEAGGDTALQLELATAYQKIADVQGNPQLSNLGQPKAALESYSKALAIAERLGHSAPALTLVADGYRGLALVYNWGLGRPVDAEKNVRLAIGIADSIPRETGQPAYGLRSNAYGTLGEFLTYRDPAAALQPLKQATAITREWTQAKGDSDSQFSHAIAMARLGAASQETGDLTAALGLFSSALSLDEQLLAKQPDNVVWKRERFIYYERLGWVTGHPQYFNLGDRKQAAAWMRKQVAAAEPLFTADQADLRARFDLSEALAELGAVTRESDPAGAEQLYRRFLALNESVLAATPGDSNVIFSQVFNRVGFAWVLEHLGKRRDALAQLDAAVERLRKLAGQQADDVRFRQYLGLALHTRGGHRLRAGDRAGAAQDLENSRGILEPLYGENPQNLTRLRDLADCYQLFGDLYASRSEWKPAQVWYQKSLELWDRWRQAGSSSIYDSQRRDLAAGRVTNAVRKINVSRR